MYCSVMSCNVIVMYDCNVSFYAWIDGCMVGILLDVVSQNLVNNGPITLDQIQPLNRLCVIETHLPVCI